MVISFRDAASLTLSGMGPPKIEMQLYLGVGAAAMPH